MSIDLDYRQSIYTGTAQDPIIEVSLSCYSDDVGIHLKKDHEKIQISLSDLKEINIVVEKYVRALKVFEVMS